MTLNIAICDDNHSDTNLLSDLLTMHSIRMDIDFNISCFTEGESLLKTISDSQTFPYQMIFLDIEMPNNNGINIARDINLRMPFDTFLVFVSSYPKYMQESFSVHPFDFIQKPVTSDQLAKLMSDVHDRILKRQRQLFCVTKDGNEVSVHANDILYIQALNAKLQDMIIYTPTGSFLKRGIISDMEKQYSDLLVPINRSTLVSLLHVHYLTDREVVLLDGKTLSVSVRNRKNLIRILKSNPTIGL